MYAEEGNAGFSDEVDGLETPPDSDDEMDESESDEEEISEQMRLCEL